MRLILFPLFGSAVLTDLIKSHGQFELGDITLRQFPDDETYIKINSDVKNKKIIFVANMVRPNPKIMPLLFLAKTARDLGAVEIGLIAPYLVYMRQDKQFHPGEGVTSTYFSEMISHYFDFLMTVDPHLHRYNALNEIYTIPAIALHAIDPIAQWIKNNVSQPVIIGPDQESAQWAEKIAQKIQAPFAILNKIRTGDRSVFVSSPEIACYKNHTPILIDDIISSGKTVLASIQQLKSLNMKAPICIGIHAVFSDSAYQDLLASGAEKIVTCNTIPHISNEIDLSELIYQGMKNDVIT